MYLSLYGFVLSFYMTLPFSKLFWRCETQYSNAKRNKLRSSDTKFFTSHNSVRFNEGKSFLQKMILFQHSDNIRCF